MNVHREQPIVLHIQHVIILWVHMFVIVILATRLTEMDSVKVSFIILKIQI